MQTYSHIPQIGQNELIQELKVVKWVIFFASGYFLKIKDYR